MECYNIMNQINAAGKNQYKAFSLLSMIYITIILAADVLIYKIAQVDDFTFTVGSLVTPFWFLMTDIIAEVYGYQLTRRLIVRHLLWLPVHASLRPSHPSSPHQPPGNFKAHMTKFSENFQEYY